ncbi:hypothetical protein COOONC_09331 [Cooperia oncophora]
MSFTESYSSRYPPIASRQDKAVYSAAPVKTSFARSVPSYEEIYSAPSKPILKAYDIDLSIHIDASTSMAPPRLGRVTCTFDEVDAYRPRTSAAKLDLPLINQLWSAGVAVLRPETNPSWKPDNPGLRPQPFVVEEQWEQQMMPKPKWYSSSVDGGPESSTLPKNFLRKPSVLHTAAPVEVAAIPFIDDDVPAPPKPARSYTELGGFSQDVQEKVTPRLLDSFEKKSGLLTCTAKPVQLVDPVTSVVRRDPKPLELSRSSFLPATAEQSKPVVKIVPAQDGGLPSAQRKRYPWQIASTDEEKPPPPVPNEISHDVSHFREDSGYRSDRKSSMEFPTELGTRPALFVEPQVPLDSQKALLDESFSESEWVSDDGDFPWDDNGQPPMNSKRYSLVLRTQTPLRVKTIIDKLLSNTGRDQRRALFSLKKIFQDDRDLVPEFVQNGGLDCMVRLGRLADQNHQNYILRALGQVMLYVDGMNGIIAHNTTIQWLYELLDSPLFDEKERREMSPFRLEWNCL